MGNMMSDVKFMVNMLPVGDHVGHRSVQRRCVGLARGVGRPRDLGDNDDGGIMVIGGINYDDGDDSAANVGTAAEYFHLQPISGRHRRGEGGSNWGVNRLALSSVVQRLTCWIFYFFSSICLFCGTG